MERFTNNNIKYWNQIQAELTDYSEEFTFQYIEMSNRWRHAFSIAQFQSAPNQLYFRIWNRYVDNQRFFQGIYNLDRLAIKNYTLQLTATQKQKVRDLLDEEFETFERENVVLGGLHCKLTFNEQTLQWNLDEEMNPNLNELISFLRKKVDFFYGLIEE